MSRPRLLYVCFWHPAGSGSGVHRARRLTRQLARLGWDIVLLCGPSYGEGPDPPLGVTILSTFSPCPRRSTRKSAARTTSAVSAKPEAPSRARRFVREALYVPDPQIYWVPFAVPAALRAHASAPFTATLCSAPPFSAFLIGEALRVRHRVPLVLDYRDVWLGHPWWPVPRWRAPIETWLERTLQRGADLVIANHESMRNSLLRSNPTLDGKMIVVPNGFDPDELGPPVRPSRHPDERFEIVYAGTLYGPRREDAGRPDALSVVRPVGLFDALARLRQQDAFGPGGVRLRFIGAHPGGSQEAVLTECARAHGLSDVVEVVPRVPRETLIPWLREAHLLLNYFYHTDAQVAQKLYEYLHLEIPVLSLLRDSAGNAVVAQAARCGPIADPGDAPAIAAAIQAILDAYARGASPSVNRPYIDQFDSRRQAIALATRIAEIGISSSARAVSVRER